MKIFIIVSSLGGGGAERVAAVVGRGLSESNHEVSIVTDTLHPATYDVGDKVRLLALYPETTNKLWKWSAAIFKLRSHVRRYHPDVCIGIASACSVISKFACLFTGIPTVMTEHSAFEFVDSENFGFLRNLKYRCAIDKLFPLVTVLTRPDLEIAKTRLKHVVVMHNPSTFPQYTGELHKDKIILAVGRLFDWHYKGFDILIQAWAKISNNHPDWKIKIAGNGTPDDFKFLKKKADDLGVSDSIDFLGFQTDMIKLYREAAIFVLSSRSEGLPMVLIEAMSQGCAPVATDFKGRTREIITSDKEGLLCPPERPDLLAKNLEMMIQDDAYRKNVQRQAIERSKAFNVDKIVSDWEVTLNNLCSKEI